MDINIKITSAQLRKYAQFQILDHFIGRKRAYSMTLKNRRKFYVQLESSLKEQGPGKIIPVDRRTNLSLEEFQREYVDGMKPVILEGAAKEWNCVKEWSLDYFKKLHGEDVIVMADQLKMENPYEVMTLADLIDGIHKGTGKYYRFYPLLDKHPEHILDFDYKWLRERRNRGTLFEAFQVFMGGDNTITPIHNANQCNLFTQVYGEKKWMLYHPKHTPIVDPNPVRNVYRDGPAKTESGPFDPFNPDFSGPYKLFQYIDGYSVHLKPGDVLWNPPFYWHSVKNVGNSIGVGYRWLPPAYCFKCSKLYTFLDAFATNPPIWKAYKLYKQDINLIHMAEHGQLDDYIQKRKKS